jgi:cytochrome P450
MAYMPFQQVDLGPLSPYGRFKRVRAEFDDILYGSIREARAGGRGRDDILARLIREGEQSDDPLDDAELRDELLTLLIAGHETTASTLAWALQWILGLPEVCARLTAEVREVVGDGPVDPSAMGELPYVEACLKEALRLHPPAMSLSRWVARPTTLAGFDLPVGTHVNPSPYLTQRLERLYPQADRYRPERFLEGERPSPFAFYPFGGGRRLCVGAPFALYQMTIVMATLFSSCRLRLTHPPTRAAQRKAVIVVPRGGVEVSREPVAS